MNKQPLKPLGKEAGRVQLEHDVRDVLQLGLYHGLTKSECAQVLISIAFDLQRNG